MPSDTIVFIPAWNEAANLPAVLDEVRAGLPEADVLVVDDGSTDGTAAVARSTARRSSRSGRTVDCDTESRPGTRTPRRTATHSQEGSTPTANTPSTNLYASSRSCAQARPTSP